MTSERRRRADDVGRPGSVADGVVERGVVHGEARGPGRTSLGKVLFALVAAAGTLTVAGGARAGTPAQDDTPPTDSTYTLSPSETPPVGSTYTLSPGGTPPRAETPRTMERWYGVPTLITDGVAVAAFVGFLSTFRICLNIFNTSRCPDNTAPMLLFTGSALSYGLGGPINHAAHGHWGKAGLSLGMRASPILMAVAVGAVSNERTEMSTPLVLMGGVLAAMIVDAGVLANDTVVVDPTEPRFTLLPQFDPKTRAGVLSVGGTF